MSHSERIEKLSTDGEGFKQSVDLAELVRYRLTLRHSVNEMQKQLDHLVVRKVELDAEIAEHEANISALTVLIGSAE
jgi:hypothetical protein